MSKSLSEARDEAMENWELNLRETPRIAGREIDMTNTKTKLPKLLTDTKMMIQDDNGIWWRWNGNWLLCDGDDSEGGGYDCASPEDALETLHDGGYLS